MKIRRVLIPLLIVAFLIPSTALAAKRSPYVRKSNPYWGKRSPYFPGRNQSYSSRVGQKASNGIKNTLLGWTSLVTEPYEAAQNNESVLTGVGSGLQKTVTRTVGGIAETLTAPLASDHTFLPEED